MVVVPVNYEHIEPVNVPFSVAVPVVIFAVCEYKPILCPTAIVLHQSLRVFYGNVGIDEHDLLQCVTLGVFNESRNGDVWNLLHPLHRVMHGDKLNARIPFPQLVYFGRAVE